MRKHQILIVGLTVFLDAVTKWMVIRWIPLDDDMEIIPGFFRLTHLHNTGVAFSMFADAPWRWKTAILAGFSCAAVTAIIVLLWKSGAVLNATTWSLSLVLGGALGNPWERVLRGSVTDFLDFYTGSHHWPPFNIADSAIVIGSMLLLIRVFLGTHDR